MKILLVLLLAPVAAAQPVPDDAQRHFIDGYAHYGAGRYQQALDEFEQARRLTPLAAYDYEVARCLDRLGRARAAIVEYKRYVLRTPDLKEAEAAKRRVQELKQLVDGPAPPRRLRILAAVLAVGVAAGAIVGGALLGSVGPGYDQLRAECRQRECDRPDWQTLETRADAGYGILAAVAVVAAGDVALWVVDGRRPRGASFAWTGSSLRLTF